MVKNYTVEKFIFTKINLEGDAHVLALIVVEVHVAEVDRREVAVVPNHIQIDLSHRHVVELVVMMIAIVPKVPTHVDLIHLDQDLDLEVKVHVEEMMLMAEPMVQCLVQDLDQNLQKIDVVDLDHLKAEMILALVLLRWMEKITPTTVVILWMLIKFEAY